MINDKARMLPSGVISKEYFVGTKSDLEAAICNMIFDVGALTFPKHNFTIQESNEISSDEMSSDALLMRLLETLILIKRPMRVLEIGTFVGLSAMHMARVMPARGQVTTIEKYGHFAEIARHNFAQNGFQDKIRLIEGDALEQLNKLDSAERFDMAFLDGNKERYAEYLMILDRLLVPRGLLVVDDVFFQGDTFNETPKTDKGAGVKKLLDLAKSMNSYSKTILPIGNGVMLMVRL